VKIVVAIKQVPDTETKVAVGPGGKSIDESNVNLVVNPYDEFALEEALRIKEAKGAGDVIVVTVGPEKAAQALRTCLAVGADRGVHVKDPAAAGADGTDSLGVAKILAAVVKEIGPDLVLTGKYAVGSDNQLAGGMLAELLGWPHVSVVTKLTMGDGKCTAEREIEGALEIVESALPCVITAQKGLNEPRYASLKGIMAAKKKPIEEKTLAALGLSAEAIKARVAWETLSLPPAKQAGRIIKAEEDPAAAVKELVRLLHDEAKVI
jgi:electron transfer flavoprotein beta subunit